MGAAPNSAARYLIFKVDLSTWLSSYGTYFHALKRLRQTAKSVSTAIILAGLSLPDLGAGSAVGSTGLPWWSRFLPNGFLEYWIRIPPRSELCKMAPYIAPCIMTNCFIRTHWSRRKKVAFSQLQGQGEPLQIQPLIAARHNRCSASYQAGTRDTSVRTFWRQTATVSVPFIFKSSRMHKLIHAKYPHFWMYIEILRDKCQIPVVSHETAIAAARSEKSTNAVAVFALRTTLRVTKPGCALNKPINSCSLTWSPRLPTKRVLHGGLSLVLLTCGIIFLYFMGCRMRWGSRKLANHLLYSTSIVFFSMLLFSMRLRGAKDICVSAATYNYSGYICTSRRWST